MSLFILLLIQKPVWTGQTCFAVDLRGKGINDWKMISQLTEKLKFMNDEETCELDLSFNNISRIQSNTFNKLTHLEILNLSYNKILFDYTNKLKKLSLNNNRLTKLPPNIFSELVNLSYLDLSSNKFSEFNLTLAKGNQLSTLDLSNNRISSLRNDSFMNLPNLETLKIKNNSLTSISPCTFSQLTKLKHIELSSNRLTSFDFGLIETNLELAYLNLCNNSMILENCDNLAELNKTWRRSNDTIDCEGGRKLTTLTTQQLTTFTLTSTTTKPTQNSKRTTSKIATTSTKTSTSTKTTTTTTTSTTSTTTKTSTQTPSRITKNEITSTTTGTSSSFSFSTTEIIRVENSTVTRTNHTKQQPSNSVPWLSIPVSRDLLVRILFFAYAGTLVYFICMSLVASNRPGMFRFLKFSPRRRNHFEK